MRNVMNDECMASHKGMDPDSAPPSEGSKWDRDLVKFRLGLALLALLSFPV